IPLECLPRTFREAVNITRAIGQRYIWIDSLCIIQDSIEDWEAEAAKMAEVYSKSLCTLVATSAHSNGGCISLRDSNEVTSATLVLSSQSGSLSRKVTIFPRLPIDNELVEKAPVSQRAWCLQEQELSTRSVQFTSHQFLWRCKTATTSEGAIRGAMENPAGRINLADFKACYEYVKRELFGSSNARGADLNSASIVSKTTQDLSHEYYTYWYKTMESYANRNITIEADRLPAISGLAQRQVIYWDDQFLAGIWAKDILPGLLWRQRTLFGEGGRLKRPKGFIAPSWSWICLSAPVVFEPSPFSWKGVGPEIHDRVWLNPLNPIFVDAEIVHAGKDSYGQVRSGRITLSGRLRAGKCPQKESSSPGEFLVDVQDPITKKFVGRVYFDTLADMESHRSITCLCMFEWIVRDLPRNGGGLALVPKSEDSACNEYTRVGFVDMLETTLFDEIDAAVFSII
ncbi:HET-domain-containing protein, partial [Glonium stellatum]